MHDDPAPACQLVLPIFQGNPLIIDLTYDQKLIQDMRMCDLDQFVEQGIVLGVYKISRIVTHLFQ